MLLRPLQDERATIGTHTVFVALTRLRHCELQTLNRHAVKSQSAVSNPLAEGSTCVMLRGVMDFTNVFRQKKKCF